MKKTAVDFLKEKLTYVFVNDKSFNELFEQAKAMEKDQMIDFYNEGWNNADLYEFYPAERYYNETFKSE
jgi:hypothetical protein